MKARRLYWLALYFLSPLIPILLILSSPTNVAADWIYVVSAVSGACAYVWLVNQFIISARPKFIEQFFGMDKMYRFHALMAVISAALAFIHSRIKIFLTGVSPLISQIALVLFFFTVVFGLIFLVDSGFRKAPGVGWLHRFSVNKLGLTFNQAVLLHNITLVATTLMLLHVLDSSAAIVFLPVRFFYIIYFAFGISFYIYHKFVRPIRLGRKAYRLESVRPESPNVNTLILTPPPGEEVLRYKPGQFAFITILAEALPGEEHPFTISSSPFNNGYLSFTIKALGDFTSAIHKVKPGARVRVDAPYGYFSYRNYPPDRELVFITGGIGITPILSMLRSLRVSDRQRRVTLLWGVNQLADLICKDEFAVFEKEMPNFRWYPIVAFDETWQGERGFIDQEKIQRLVLEDGGDDRLKDFYICGPPALMALTFANLKALRVPSSHIRVEKFAL